ncbi:hypothetical protein [Catenulispora pinisilvae]|uniref:hypothetical protein n=1 Tax=Catenulispora pinisilvae TaxID=2705253 RepID=UPI001891352F|nr:hypothetical protein [Catenulispora pinisilvae]
MVVPEIVVNSRPSTVVDVVAGTAPVTEAEQVFGADVAGLTDVAGVLGAAAGATCALARDGPAECAPNATAPAATPSTASDDPAAVARCRTRRRRAPRITPAAETPRVVTPS